MRGMDYRYYVHLILLSLSLEFYRENWTEERTLTNTTGWSRTAFQVVVTERLIVAEIGAQMSEISGEWGLHKCTILCLIKHWHRSFIVNSIQVADMELGHILWPSDPVTWESSDSETQLTRWPCSIMNSKCRLMLQTNVCNGQEVCQLLSLFGVCRLLESKILKIIY